MNLDFAPFAFFAVEKPNHKVRNGLRKERKERKNTTNCLHALLREHPSLVGDLYNGLHSFFSDFYMEVFLWSLFPPTNAHFSRKNSTSYSTAAVLSPASKHSSSSKDKKFTESRAEAPVLPHRALFVLCNFFPPTP